MTSVHQHLQDGLADLTDALTVLHKLLPPANTLRRLEDHGDRGCQSCKRIPGPAGTPWYAATEKPGATLCRTCRRHTDARRQDWQRTHPTHPAPSDNKRFWPPTGALVQLRDNGHMRASPVQWAAWDQADRPTKKRKKAS